MFGFLPPKRGKFDKPPFGTQPPLSEGLINSFDFSEYAGVHALDRASPGFAEMRSVDSYWQPGVGLSNPFISNGVLKGMKKPGFILPQLSTVEVLFTPLADFFPGAPRDNIVFDTEAPEHDLLAADSGSTTPHWTLRLNGVLQGSPVTPTSILAGVTYHIVLVIDSTESRLYIDGKLEITWARSGPGPSPLPHVLHIGDLSFYAVQSRASNSTMHFFRVYRGTKSVEQIQHMAQNPYRTDEPESPFMGVFDEAGPVAPDAPLNPFATAGDEEVTSGCDTSATATSYNLYWSDTSPVTTGDTKVTSADRTGEIVTGLDNGTPYYFAWTAENAQGESDLSSEATATPAEAVIVPHIPTWVELALADYQPMGKWRTESWERGDSLNLTLRDIKSRLEATVAPNIFSFDDHPNADPGIWGETIPVAWGPQLGATAFLIDIATSTFQVAESVASFTRFISELGVVVPDSTDTANGKFVYTSYDEETDGAITVDFVGANENPADLIEDLITTWGGVVSSDLHEPGSGDPDEGQGFGTFGSRTEWIVGHDRKGNEVHRPALSIYLDQPTSITSIISLVEKASFGLFYVNLAGEYTFRHWETVRGQDATFTLEEADILSWGQDETISDILTQVNIEFRTNRTTGTSQAVTVTDTEGRYLRGDAALTVEDFESPFHLKVDAQQFGSRYLFTRSRPTHTVSIACNVRAWGVEPGDTIRAIWPDRDVDGFFDVLDMSPDLEAGTTELVVSNNRGFGDTIGFPAIDSPVFPASLGGASAETWLESWTPDQKKFARQNFLYFTDDNEFADPTDADSFRPGVTS